MNEHVYYESIRKNVHIKIGRKEMNLINDPEDKNIVTSSLE
jgi:hypothetical protein